MIHLRLRHEGWVINLKRVRRRYRLENLMVRRRRRKKVPLGERQPWVRPSRRYEVWSLDFVFDRLADGRSLKCLTVVDDCTHEAVAIQPDRAISGAYVARILDRVKSERGLPKVIRSDNGKEFCGRAMVTWAHENSVALRFIEPGKPNQNAYVESFNGRLRDECLNEHWFTTLTEARALIEAWRGDYNEHRPKKDLGGIPPAVYAARLTASVLAGGEALRLATRRYESGYTGYLEVLDSQRTLNISQLVLIRNRQALLAADVDLMKALGGGWNPPQQATVAC